MFLEAHVMPFIYKNKKVITISNSTKEEIIKHGLQVRKDIDIVTPGIDIQSFFLSEKTKYPSMVYVGRLKSYKNVHIAINAFATILAKYPNAKFYIAGEGEGIVRLLQLVKKLQIENNVSFLGKISEREKIALLGKSWLAVQPSQIEGWGITVIEANAAGTPVVASNVNGLKDSVVDTKTGMLVKVGDVVALVQAIDTILSDKKLRDRMKEAALSWASLFSWDESSIVAERIIFTELVQLSKNTTKAFSIAPGVK
jgi:glycosyltransferase involved in cell wall biosynthesis